MQLTLAIATWNRADLLAQTLASLGSLVIPAQVTWDVLICDNNSSDHTKQVVDRELASLKSLNLQGLTTIAYLFEPTQGKSHALNRILREAGGEWVLFLDDDVIVDANWLAAYVDAMAKHPAAGVLGGPVIPKLDGVISRAQSHLLAQFGGAYGALRFEHDTPITQGTITPGGANMAVRTETARTLGFDLSRGMFQGARIAGEDMMMALRIIEQGHEGWMIAGAKVHHHTPAKDVTRRRLFRWQMGIGRGWAHERGRPTPGRFGIAWWAWREMARRTGRMIFRWRPWPSRSYDQAMIEVAQYWGYLRAK